MLKFSFIVLLALVLTATGLELSGHTHGFGPYILAVVWGLAVLTFLVRPGWRTWVLAAALLVVGGGLHRFADAGFAWVWACGVGLVAGCVVVFLSDWFQRR